MIGIWCEYKEMNLALKLSFMNKFKENGIKNEAV